ncbi:MAG TPA: hypothetical protein VMO47_12640 [Rhodothermales bacterium]|nr:hypothetical protein [Rhodothermales bacterium]
MTANQLRDAAIIGAVVQKVGQKKLFCGETFLQKSAFFMKELFGVPLESSFRLYYYGPFSFDLRSQLMAMRGDRFVSLVPHERGAHFASGEQYANLASRFPKTLEKYAPAIEFAATELAGKGVKQLEPLATALYLRRENADRDTEELASRLVEIKPHVEMPAARTALKTVDEWIERVS